MATGKPESVANLARVPISSEGMRTRAHYLEGGKDVDAIFTKREGDPLAWRSEQYGAGSVVIEEIWKTILRRFAGKPIPLIGSERDFWTQWMHQHDAAVFSEENAAVKVWASELVNKDRVDMSNVDIAFVGFQHSLRQENPRVQGSFVPSSLGLTVAVGNISRVAGTLFENEKKRPINPEELSSALHGKSLKYLLVGLMLNSNPVAIHCMTQIFPNWPKGNGSTGTTEPSIRDNFFFLRFDARGMPEIHLKSAFLEEYRVLLKASLADRNPAHQQETLYTLGCPFAYSSVSMERVMDFFFDEAVRQYRDYYERMQKIETTAPSLSQSE
ncbi:MAG TPA: hypothetical protein VI957_01780 [Candidatus Paceibacterota bacterium]